MALVDATHAARACNSVLAIALRAVTSLASDESGSDAASGDAGDGGGGKRAAGAGGRGKPTKSALVTKTSKREANDAELERQQQVRAAAHGVARRADARVASRRPPTAACRRRFRWHLSRSPTACAAPTGAPPPPPAAVGVADARRRWRRRDALLRRLLRLHQLLMQRVPPALAESAA